MKITPKQKILTLYKPPKEFTLKQWLEEQQKAAEFEVTRAIDKSDHPRP